MKSKIEKIKEEFLKNPKDYKKFPKIDWETEKPKRKSKDRISSDLNIYIVEPGIHQGWWDRFKTRIWNFILPPHLRLEIVDSDSHCELVSD